MCVDPMTLIGTAISLAGTAAQAAQQSAMVNAQNKTNRDAYEISKRAREAEQARQSVYERQAADDWASTTEALSKDRYDATKAQNEQDFMQDFDAAQGAVQEGELLSGQEFASDAVKTEIAARSNKAAQEARSRVKALAALTGTDLTGANRGFILGNNADKLGTLNSLRRGSLGVSNQEQNIAPAQVNQGSSLMGDVLSGAGGIIAQRGAYNATVNSK